MSEAGENITTRPACVMEQFLTFRMDRVERDMSRLERLMEQAFSRDSVSREALNKAMYDLTTKQEETAKKMAEIIDIMKPVIDDYRQRSYGHTYVSRYFSVSRYMAALALAAVLLLALPFLPGIVAFLMR